jgi:hypothetical protein
MAVLGACTAAGILYDGTDWESPWPWSGQTVSGLSVGSRKEHPRVWLGSINYTITPGDLY